MPNYVPYFILLVISLSLLGWIILRKRSFGLLALFFAFSGMVYVAEFFVLVLWDAYAYFPGVFAVRYHDNIAGAVVSNLLIIPALGMLVAVYRLRAVWIVLFAASLVGVEWVFTYLDIYKSHWWKLAYTGGVLVFFFYLVKFWYEQLQKGHRFLRFMSLWMQGWSMVATVMYLLAIIGVRMYHVGTFDDVYRDDIFFGTFMGLFKSGIFAAFIAGTSRLRVQLLAPLLVLVVDLPLIYLGWLKVFISLWIYCPVYIVLALLLLWWNRYAYQFFCELVLEK